MFRRDFIMIAFTFVGPRRFQCRSPTSDCSNIVYPVAAGKAWYRGYLTCGYGLNDDGTDTCDIDRGTL